MHATPKTVAATTVAIDLAKVVFQLSFADAAYRVVERERLTRGAFARELENRSQHGRRRARQQDRKTALGHRTPSNIFRPEQRQRATLADLPLTLPALPELQLMAQRVGPRNEHADNSVGEPSPIKRVAPIRGFHDGPSARAHPKAEYTTATAPLRQRSELGIS